MYGNNNAKPGFLVTYRELPCNKEARHEKTDHDCIIKEVVNPEIWEYYEKNTVTKQMADKANASMGRLLVGNAHLLISLQADNTTVKRRSVLDISQYRTSPGSQWKQWSTHCLVLCKYISCDNNMAVCRVVSKSPRWVLLSSSEYRPIGDTSDIRNDKTREGFFGDLVLGDILDMGRRYEKGS